MVFKRLRLICAAMTTFFHIQCLLFAIYLSPSVFH